MGKYDAPIDLRKGTDTGLLIEKISPNSSVLEFGCAEGRMTRYMKESLNCMVCIVELDRESFSKAMLYADEGVCCDACTLEWTKAFEGKHFDYILFADVLEHLQQPDLVLKSAASFLKEDGQVLVSIPNIGHADVICALLCNRFRYTETGLLDNTHIHFWGREDFHDFAENAGFSVVEENAIYKVPNTTEQAINSRELSAETKLLVASMPYTNVYQFVFTLQKRSWVEQNKIPEISLIESAADTGAEMDAISGILRNLRQEKEEAEEQLAHYRDEYLTALSQRDDIALRLSEAQKAYSEIENSKFWKITKPFRACIDLIKGSGKK